MYRPPDSIISIINGFRNKSLEEKLGKSIQKIHWHSLKIVAKRSIFRYNVFLKNPFHNVCLNFCVFDVVAFSYK